MQHISMRNCNDKRKINIYTGCPIYKWLVWPAGVLRAAGAAVAWARTDALFAAKVLLPGGAARLAAAAYTAHIVSTDCPRPAVGCLRGIHQFHYHYHYHHSPHQCQFCRPLWPGPWGPPSLADTHWCPHRIPGPDPALCYKLSLEREMAN